MINVPARGIGDKTLEELRAWADGARRPLWAAVEAAETNPNLATRARTALAGFAELVRGLSAVAQASRRHRSSRRAWSGAACGRCLTMARRRATERWANLVELRNHAAEFDQLAAPEGLARFLEEVALVSTRTRSRSARNA